MARTYHQLICFDDTRYFQQNGFLFVVRTVLVATQIDGAQVFTCFGRFRYVWRRQLAAIIAITL